MVGVVQQPNTDSALFDWQQWSKPYQFWVKADASGNFTIPNVIATNNYTLYAYGPGAAGMFMSQNQTGGNPPITYNLPATPFSLTVTNGATNNLGVVTWTPTRVGPTVFEIGFPNRTGDKFRHGDDYWVGDIGPNPNSPSPVWSKWLEYPFDFPNGPNYVVGQSRWSTDWNFIQPVVTDASGNYDASTSTITFNLASAPAGGAQASLYLSTASDYEAPVILTVNGNNLGSVSGVTGNPIAPVSTGYFPAYNNDESDANIREGIHGVFSDNRVTFPGTLLKAGQNTINIGLRSRAYFANHFIYDYVRLELTGYVPPAPAGVTAWPGNNCNLLSWPVTPGATSYKILRSTNSVSGYATIATNIGPVCGSGSNNSIYLDTNVLNGANYYYVVQSVNTIGASANSVPGPVATPYGSAPVAVPSVPAGLVATAGHTNVSLLWSAPPGANYYSVWRSTLVNTGGGSTNILGTNILSNITTNAAYTDTAVTDGTYYSYFVTAANAAGLSANSASANATPLPPPPAGAPAGLTVSRAETATNQTDTLTWTAVPGAVGYIIYRATSPTGPFAFPGEYVMSITETTYADTVDLGTYYYVVVAMNVAGVSDISSIVSTAAAPTSATTTVLALTAGVSPCAYGSSLTFQATVTPTPPDGETVDFYSDSVGIGMAATTNGVAALTVNNLPSAAAAQSITATYLGNSTNKASGSAALSQTVTQGTLTYVATPASRAYGSPNPTFAGVVTGFVNGETLGGATTGTLLLTTPASTASAAGNYAINVSGLSAKNYAFAQAAANAAALTITKAFIPRPVFQPPALSAGGLVFTGGGGAANTPYYILDSTNLVAPLSNWTILLTNLFDPNGNFNFTNAPDPANPQLFYILQLP